MERYGYQKIANGYLDKVRVGLVFGSMQHDVVSDPKNAELFKEATSSLEALQEILKTSVPAFKFSGLANQTLMMDQEIAALRREVRELRFAGEEVVWYWQADGGNHVESLNCPVVIPADELRHIMADHIEAEREVTKERFRIMELMVQKIGREPGPDDTIESLLEELAGTQISGEEAQTGVAAPAYIEDCPRPLPFGSVVEYADMRGIVLEDHGSTLLVRHEDQKIEWRWHFDGESCKVISLPPEGVEDVTLRALAAYRAPFRYSRGYVYDAKSDMVSDTGGAADHIQRIRGWGMISYMKDAEAIQDEVGRLVAESLNTHWEHYRKLLGW